METAPDWIRECNFKTVKVILASKVVKQIIDQDLEKRLLSQLYQYIGSPKSISGFPGSLAASILRSNMDRISHGDYRILLKSDGIRYWMFICELQDEKGKPIHIVDLINRSCTHYIIQTAFPAKLYKGTIFDGELVQSKSGFEFQIFDCLSFVGNYVGNEKHTKRLQFARNALQQYIPKDSYTFRITVKEYVSPDKALELLCDNNQDFPIDGWILIDVEKPYVFGKDEALFKYKLKDDHTLDFVLSYKKTMSSEQSHGVLCVIDGGRLVPVQDTTEITKDILSKFNVADERMLEGVILECKWSPQLCKWVPIKTRFDKDIPNNFLTYERTKRNIEENITLKEMHQLFEKKSIPAKIKL